MRTGHASRTAEYNALFRALESQRRDGERLFDDPLARAFLTPPLAQVADVARVRAGHRLVVSLIDRRWPGPRTSVVARTRLIDDTIDALLDGGTDQVVVLGAGYDSRPYRLPALRERRVFEVDHPDTQRHKRAVVERTGAGAGVDVRFVPTDFHLGRLDDAMTAAGFEPGAPTLILWEGTSNYLTGPVVEDTLRWCARAAAGGHLIFTYIHRDALTHPERFTGADRSVRTIGRHGEAWTFGMEPEELPTRLARLGLSLESDVGAADFRELYFGEEARTMRGHEFYRVATARSVPEEAARATAR